MRTYDDIARMAAQDYSIGVTAHYQPLANFIESRQYKSIIEVGTAYAGNASYLIKHANIDRLICVDPYRYYPAMPGFVCQEEYDTLFQFAQDRLAGNSGVRFIRRTSKEAFDLLSPVDLVFLDGSHEYEDVKWECENYYQLIKPGGVLSGHDYGIFEGVTKAVDEFSRMTMERAYFLPGNIWYINY